MKQKSTQFMGLRVKPAMTTLIIGLLFSATVFGQKVAVKTNLLYGATTTPNLAVEIPLRPRATLDVAIGYNPWSFGADQKIKHWLIEPEYRYWLCENFNGSFFGLHGLYTHYNVGGIGLTLPEFTGAQLDKAYRYQGTAFGGGLSYGYHWMLNARWGLEFEIGLGVALSKYDKYECQECGNKLGSGDRLYTGVTKAGISVVYLLY
jgi:hypothetical protein